MDDGAHAAEMTGATGTGVNWFFAGLVAGAAVAGIAALLYAPRSGQETRESLKTEIAATQDMLQRWTREAQARFENFSRIIRSSARPEMQPAGNGQRETC